MGIVIRAFSARQTETHMCLGEASSRVSLASPCAWGFEGWCNGLDQQWSKTSLEIVPSILKPLYTSMASSFLR